MMLNFARIVPTVRTTLPPSDSSMKPNECSIRLRTLDIALLLSTLGPRSPIVDLLANTGGRSASIKLLGDLLARVAHFSEEQDLLFTALCPTQLLINHLGIMHSRRRRKDLDNQFTDGAHQEVSLVSVMHFIALFWCFKEA